MDNIGNVFYFQWELDFLHWLQDKHSNFLDFIMPKITFLGDAGWFWILVVILFLVLPYNRKVGVQAVVGLAISALICNLILKPELMRCRPCWLEPEIPLLTTNPVDYSFPSGHTNASFAVATTIFTRNKKLGVPALILAGAIAFSRIYLFVHWPTDVIVGTATGIMGGIAGYIIVNYYSNKKKKLKI